MSEEREIQSGPFKGKKIVFAPQDRVKELTPWIHVVLEAIGFPTAFVTDRSMIGDFCLEDDELKKAEENLGIPLSHKDYVVDVAKRMKEKTTKR